MIEMLGRYDTWRFHRDPHGEWRWTRSAGVAVVGKSTEGYHNLADAEANATRLGWQLESWPIVLRPDRWEFYRDADRLWRWRRQARNGRIVGAAHLGFDDLADAQANARRFGWQPRPEPPPSAETDDWRTCRAEPAQARAGLVRK